MKTTRAFILVMILISAIAGLMADKVSDFKLEDMNGKQVWLSEIQGDNLVILDFWATWCVPCKKSLPKMNEIHQKYDKVTVVTICTDKPRNKMEAKAFLKSNRFSFVSLFDPQGSVMKLFNVTNIPRSFVITPEGEIIYDHTGYQRGDEKHYEEVIEKWLQDQDEPLQKMDETKKPNMEKLSKEAEKDIGADEIRPVTDEKKEETDPQQDK